MSIEEFKKECEKLRKELEQLKAKAAERVSEAKYLNIHSTAASVARHLGAPQDKRYGNYWIYDDGELRITYDDYGGSLSIRYKGHTVFSSRHSDTIYRYIPGEWVNKLNELSEKAEKLRLMKEIKSLQFEIKRLKEDWGL